MIEMYIKPTCPYCVEAKALLEKKGQVIQYYDITNNPPLRAEMLERAKRHTVPQIFINNRHIGGCDDLMLLEDKGKLDTLLTLEK
ncbi:glutaredoxin 3 [Fangia hongkongensis]|uniref:glutaredoxin 3 n=1 Tax=Fangia hongkongensis TaxID=270495 RepID=UPI000368A387|nr:glutaredoxin 3 [Fangia hongkongensis]MBK2125682.1 glutaredoxin 3 [Fangia hongkongensis]